MAAAVLGGESNGGIGMGMRASETAAMFMPEEKALEDRKLFVPKYFSSGDLINGSVAYCDLYDFITAENSPVYLPELVEGSEK